MSETDVILENGTETIVVARGVGGGWRALPPAAAATLRTALRFYAVSGNSLTPLENLWADVADRRSTRLAPHAVLIEQVCAAVDSGLLKAWVFREPPHLCGADPDLLKAQAVSRAIELRAEDAAGRLRSISAVGQVHQPGEPAARNVADMPLGDRFIEALVRAKELVAPEMRTQLEAILKDPSALGLMAGTFAIMLALQSVAVGEAIDAVALAALIACAMLRGYSLYMAVRSALEAVEHFVTFLIDVSTAKTDADLDKAAREFAGMVAAVGVAILMAAITRIAGRLQQSAKKAVLPARPKVTSSAPPSKRPFTALSQVDSDKVKVNELSRVGDIEGARKVLQPYVNRGQADEVVYMLDVGVPPNKGVLWSGNKEGAKTFAAIRGKQTLEMTAGGRIVDDWPLIQEKFPYRDNRNPFWERLSSKYASGLSGDIDVALASHKPDGGNIYRNFELPSIQDSEYAKEIIIHKDALSNPLQLSDPKD